MSSIAWVDFVWNIKRWLKYHPDEMNAAMPSSTPATGAYTITNTDYSLTSTNTAAATWTLPASPSTGQVLKVKVKGAGAITLSGSIFTDTTETSLVLVTGDMVTLRYDGSTWNVGD